MNEMSNHDGLRARSIPRSNLRNPYMKRKRNSDYTAMPPPSQEPTLKFNDHGLFAERNLNDINAKMDSETSYYPSLGYQERSSPRPSPQPLPPKPRSTTTSVTNQNIMSCGVATESASALVISAANKAGMDGINRELIDKIILEESGNSLFMQQQRRRDEKVNQRISSIRERLERQNQTDINWKIKIQRKIDRTEISSLLQSRPSRSTKVVVDMDMFYMACELLQNKELASINESQPACVGGTGMILTSNYYARKYGVRAAMPGYIASKLVTKLSNGKETLVFCKPNYSLYKQKSLEVMTILRQYDPFSMKSYSLDEAYLDLGTYVACQLRLFPPHESRIFLSNDSKHERIVETLLTSQRKKLSNAGEETNATSDPTGSSLNNLRILDQITDRYHVGSIGIDWSDKSTVDLIIHSVTPQTFLNATSNVLKEMRDRVHRVTGLTCSAGLGPNFMLAKMGSDYNKPNGQTIIEPDHDAIVQFLHPLPLRKVPGIGRVTEKILKAFYISTVEELYNERALVRFLFQTNGTNAKESQAAFLLRSSVGCTSTNESDSGLYTNEDPPHSVFGGNDEETRDTNTQQQQPHQKGISKERTFQSGQSLTSLHSKLEEIAIKLSNDMNRKSIFAHTVTVKVKLHTFDCLSKGRSLPYNVYIQDSKELIAVVTALFHDIHKDYMEQEKQKGHTAIQFSVRLLGIRCSNFKDPDGSSQEDKSKQTHLKEYLPPHPVVENIATKKKVTLKKNPYNTLSNEISSNHGVKIEEPTQQCKSNRSIISINNEGFKMRDVVSVPNHNGSSNNEIHTTEGAEYIKQDHPQCPICGIYIKVKDNDENGSINKHIDACLNGPVIRQVIQSNEKDFSQPEGQEQQTVFSIKHNQPPRIQQENKRHRKSLFDFFSTD